MKTKTEILVMIADLGWNDEAAWRIVDDALLARANALKGKSEAEMEWLLGYALDMRKRAARELLGAMQTDETVTGQLRAAINAQTSVRTEDSLFPHHMSRTPIRRETLAVRCEVLGRVVATYRAMAVERVDAEEKK